MAFTPQRLNSLVVVGLQWGDEGKGKVVDYLAKDFDINARFQGGPNAGHTVICQGKKYIFHQIPCGILNKNITAVIGAGCVLDPEVFFAELAEIEAADPQIRKRLRISKFAHLIFPYHRIIDRLREQKKGDDKIGTTQRGVGLTYEDKYARIGIRVGDLLDEDVFRNKLKANLSYKNFLLMDLYQSDPLDEKKMYEDYLKHGRGFKEMIIDDAYYLNHEMDNGKRVLFEGAQGAFLDIDFGTYPYVTSSHTIAGGLCVGLGVAPVKVEKVIGVAKAYTTRVGAGPFPTELKGSAGEALRKKGGEFGSTTGRPRRCGYFDAPLVRYSAMLNGVKEIVLTKLDILDEVDDLKIARGYSGAEEFDPFAVDKLKPVYVSVESWQEKTGSVRDFTKLPAVPRKYIEKIEELTGLKVTIISVGEAKDAIILK